MTNIETTAPAPDIEAASRTLAAILAGTPAVNDALAAAEALSILSDVITPYPPLEWPGRALWPGHRAGTVAAPGRG